MLFLFLMVVMAGCGGGSGGAAAPGGSAPVPPAATGPRIAAAVASFPAEGLPRGFVSRGHPSVAVVAVTAPDTGEAITTATVTVNGTLLAYAPELKAYRGWLDLDQEESVTLNVTSSAGSYAVTGRQSPTYPHLVSPPIPRHEDPPRFAVDVRPNQETLVTWTGKLPGPDYRYAVAVLDENAELAWPQRAAFQVLSSGTATETVIPAGAIPKGFSAVAAGITRSFEVPRAAAGSSLVVGTFSQAGVSVFDIPAAPIVAMRIWPGKLTLAPQREYRLQASGNVYDSHFEEDLTARVTWSSDSPAVSVSATGLATGVAAGTANITAKLGAVSATVAVTVIDPRPSQTAGNVVAYQIDAAHTGRAVFGVPFTLPATPTWSKTFNGAVSYPLIAGGKIFVLAAQKPEGTSGGIDLHAFDAVSGQVKWAPVPIDTVQQWAGQTFDRNKVFVVDTDGVVRAIDADTGTVVWSIKLGDHVPNIWSFMASPTAANGIVYVPAGGIGQTLCAIDADNGTLLWAARHLSGGGNGTPAVSAEGVYLAGHLQDYRIDALTGAIIWRHSGPGFGGNGLTPTLYNGKLHVRDSGEPYSRVLDAVSGEGMRPFGPAQGQLTAQSHVSTRIAAFGGGRKFELRDGTLYAIDLSTNKVAWSYTGDGKLSVAPIIIDETVIVGSFTGAVFGIDTASGQEVWKGAAGAEVLPADEWNAMGPLTGLAAGGGVLAIPAGNVLSVFKLAPK